MRENLLVDVDLPEELGTNPALLGMLVRANSSPLPGVVVKNTDTRGFPGGSVVKNLPANAGDTGRPHMPWCN